MYCMYTINLFDYFNEKYSVLIFANIVLWRMESVRSGNRNPQPNKDDYNI
jgi:hypothetical protein